MSHRIYRIEECGVHKNILMQVDLFVDEAQYNYFTLRPITTHNDAITYYVLDSQDTEAERSFSLLIIISTIFPRILFNEKLSRIALPLHMQRHTRRRNDPEIL